MITDTFQRFVTTIYEMIWACILLTVVDNLEPLQVGLALLPGAVATIMLSPVAGALSDRGQTRGVVTFGLIAVLLGCICSALMAGGSPAGTAAGMALYGAGFACIQTPLITAGSRVVSPKLLSTGNGVLMTMLFLGGAMGTAMGVALVAAMPETMGAWLPMAQVEGGGRFSNTMLLMGVPSVLSLAFIGMLPGRSGAEG